MSEVDYDAVIKKAQQYKKDKFHERKDGQTLYEKLGKPYGERAVIEVKIKAERFLVQFNESPFFDILPPLYLVYQKKNKAGYWRIMKGWRDIDWTPSVFFVGEDKP